MCDLSGIAPNVLIYEDLLNKNLEQLISQLDSDPSILTMVKRGCREERHRLYTRLMETLDEVSFQWNEMIH